MKTLLRLAAVLVAASSLFVTAIGCSSEGECEATSDCPCWECTCSGGDTAFARGCKQDSTCADGAEACAGACAAAGGDQTASSSKQADASQCGG